MKNDVLVNCDICERQHPINEELFKLCNECNKKVCFRCWVVDVGNVFCPHCKKELNQITKEELRKRSLLDLTKDNPHPFRGQTMHIESACVPQMVLRTPGEEMKSFEELKKLFDILKKERENEEDE